VCITVRTWFCFSNEDDPPKPIDGYVRINNENQDWSFNFSLHETTETVPPAISSFFIGFIPPARVGFFFNANEPVDMKVEYNLLPDGVTQTVGYFDEYVECPEGGEQCDVQIDVIPERSYTYQITVKDEWGNTSISSGGFYTDNDLLPDIPSEEKGEGEDVTAPVLFNVRLVAVSDKFVQLTWETDEPADSNLVVLLDDEEVVTNHDNAIEIVHTIGTPAVLVPEQSYTAIVSSTDRSGNSSQAAVPFVTLVGSGSSSLPAPPPSSSPPSPSPTSPPSLPIPNDTPFEEGGGSVIEKEIIFEEPPIEIAFEDGGLVIEWVLLPGAEPVDGFRIDIFTSDSKFVERRFVPGDFRKVVIPGLNQGEYYVVVYAERGGVYEKVGPPLYFNVNPQEIRVFDGLTRGHFVVVIIILIGFVSWASFRVGGTYLKQIRA
jgi:hypothetical protein